ncbi:MAG: N-acyl homoserine lactonase family protein [Betaproteobacteria bacterium]|nr:N-acyl homoserine lactonase family protein [Betaproteobacteria bacterium]
MTTPTYEIFAIKYARRDALRANHFVGGDPHDAPMPMDYFVWLVRNEERTFVIDTGFTAAMAEQRKRQYLRAPREGLALLGVRSRDVRDVVITHLHYDHVGTYFDFPNAKFHLQDEEMSYATGRHMQHRQFGHGYEVEDVVGMVRMVFKGQVAFCSGSAELAPGVSVHHIGGHTAGLQSVRVFTRRGWVVLASDASHYYEHMEAGRCFPTTFHLGQVIQGYDTLRRLAESPSHIVPGHDPLVMERYPAPSKELEGIVARLDVMPVEHRGNT